jgi:hypothetical protein
MKNGMTKAEMTDVVKNLDLVGISLCFAMDSGKTPPEYVQRALIQMLGAVRAALADSHGVIVDPVDCLADMAREQSRPSAAEVADQILSDLNNDTF